MHSSVCNCAICKRTRDFRRSKRTDVPPPPESVLDVETPTAPISVRGMLEESVQIRPNALPIGGQGTLRALVAGMIRDNAKALYTVSQARPDLGPEVVDMITKAYKDLEDWASVLESSQTIDLSMLRKRNAPKPAQGGS
jgi:hypothetical protein